MDEMSLASESQKQELEKKYTEEVSKNGQLQEQLKEWDKML